MTKRKALLSNGNYRYSKRCPNCNQFASDQHVCPAEENWRNSTGATWVENDDGALADMKAKRILTLQDLIDACEIDLTKWNIERHVINKWEVGAKDDNGEIVVEPLFQVKAWLKPLVPDATSRAFLESVMSYVK